MGSEYEDTVVQKATMKDCFALASVPWPDHLSKKPFVCPLPGHAEKTGSFHIQRSGKGYRCFGGTCGKSGGVVNFLVDMRIASTNRDALLMLGDHLHIPRDNRQHDSFMHRRKRASAPIALLPPEKREAASPESRQKLRDAIGGRVGLLTSQGKSGAEYMRTRGIEPDAADANNVRFHPGWFGKPAIVFGVYDERGSLIASQGRFLDSTANPKTMSLGPIGNGVFQTPGALQSEVLAITESPIDAISLAVNGLPAIALLGCGSKPWLRRMLKFKRIILATDDDDAGNHTADALRRELTLSITERFKFPPRDSVTKQDVNDWMQRNHVAFGAYVRTLLLDDDATPPGYEPPTLFSPTTAPESAVSPEPIPEPAAPISEPEEDLDLLAYAVARCHAVADAHPGPAAAMEARIEAYKAEAALGVLVPGDLRKRVA